ncbi:MAG: GvpL/GvpF family gas vesicle protein [Myxococcales bacterium]|nr:GvpL/GvpF family gas vesicle protein [Myxococcales bacterium]
MIGLYAIVLGAPNGGVGARGESLHTVACGELSALVGDPPAPLSVDALRAHEAAVRRIAEACDACLPARFGATSPSEEALQRELIARTAELIEALQLVRGREQMTLRVHRATGTGRESGAEIMSRSPSAGSGTRYLEARRRARKLPELDPLRVALEALTRAERVERHSEPGLLASVYHLIDKGTAPQYARIVESLKLEGLRMVVSGPWPAWSFAPEVAA